MFFIQAAVRQAVPWPRGQNTLCLLPNWARLVKYVGRGAKSSMPKGEPFGTVSILHASGLRRPAKSPGHVLRDSSMHLLQHSTGDLGSEKAGALPNGTFPRLCSEGQFWSRRQEQKAKPLAPTEPAGTAFLRRAAAASGIKAPREHEPCQ